MAPLTVPVCWLNFNDDAPHRGYWDQGLLEDLFSGRVWGTSRGPLYLAYDNCIPDAPGAVVIVPGRQNAGHVDELNAAIAPLKWVLLIVTGDEEGDFPLEAVQHPNKRVWVMTPRPTVTADRYLGSGYPPGAPDAFAGVDRTSDWFFAGQVTHARREECVAQLRDLAGGELLETPGFTQGFEQADYWRKLASSRVAPCPGGPVTPDSFRLYEALEAGCVPVADAASGCGPEPDYWQRVFGAPPPFPVVDDWAALPDVLDDVLSNWPSPRSRVSAFWLNYKRELAYAVDDDVRALSGSGPLTWKHVDDKVTVLVPTSPIPSHPSTAILEETIQSIRMQLPMAEIIVMFDGVRAEQLDQIEDYEEYINRAVRLCEREWSNVLPFIADRHLHQGLLTRRAMSLVRTPLVLFVEHDTPIIGDIDWQGCAKAIDTGEVNAIRFHHETHVLEPHQYLMLDREPQTVAGVPLLRTVQWSQRPHLASTAFYRNILDTYFGETSRTMIEDVMYGVLDTHYREEGAPGWEPFKLWMYSPPGNIKRSTHTDGRAGEPKYSMYYDYDGDTPRWAPDPGVRE